MFIAITIIFIIGYMCFIPFLYSAMQADEAFDFVSRGKWTKWINKMYNDKNKLESILGGCEKCTSFWWALPYTIAYFACTYNWGYWQMGWVASPIWIMIFWTISAMAGLVSLNKFNKNV